MKSRGGIFLVEVDGAAVARKTAAKGFPSIEEIVEAIRARFPAVHTPGKDDICYATQNRQTAVKALAEQSDVVFVLGSRTSSNANRLVEVAAKHGVRAYLVESADAVTPAMLENAAVVGLTAGASTPEALVVEAIEALGKRGYQNVEELRTAEESVVFALPRELRGAKTARADDPSGTH